MIRVLAIESATPHGSIALAEPGEVLAETPLPLGRQASATLLPVTMTLLQDAGLSPGDLTHVAVSAGPGSFTGLRVGMAAAKGLAFGWNLPLVPVPTLRALAMRFRIGGATICPVLDAKKKEVYAGFYRWEEGACVSVAPDAAVAPERLPDLLPPGRVLFCGDAIGPFGELLRERLGDRAHFPPPGEEFPAAGTVALLAASLIEKGETADIRAAVPRYLRRSEAEIKKGVGLPPSAPPK